MDEENIDYKAKFEEIEEILENQDEKKAKSGIGKGIESVRENLREIYREENNIDSNVSVNDDDVFKYCTENLESNSKIQKAYKDFVSEVDTITDTRNKKLVELAGNKEDGPEDKGGKIGEFNDMAIKEIGSRIEPLKELGLEGNYEERAKELLQQDIDKENAGKDDQEKKELTAKEIREKANELIEEDLTKINEKLPAKKEELKNKEEELNNKNNELENLKKQLDNDKISDEEKKIIDGQISELTTTISQLQKEHDTLKDQVKNMEEIVEISGMIKKGNTDLMPKVKKGFAQQKDLREDVDKELEKDFGGRNKELDEQAKAERKAREQVNDAAPAMGAVPPKQESGKAGASGGTNVAQSNGGTNIIEDNIEPIDPYEQYLNEGFESFSQNFGVPLNFNSSKNMLTKFVKLTPQAQTEMLKNPKVYSSIQKAMTEVNNPNNNFLRKIQARFTNSKLKKMHDNLDKYTKNKADDLNGKINAEDFRRKMEDYGIDQKDIKEITSLSKDEFDEKYAKDKAFREKYEKLKTGIETARRDYYDKDTEEAKYFNECIDSRVASFKFQVDYQVRVNKNNDFISLPSGDDNGKRKIGVKKDVRDEAMKYVANPEQLKNAIENTETIKNNKNIEDKNKSVSGPSL